MRLKLSALCVLMTCIASCDQATAPREVRAANHAAAAGLPHAFEPLPAAKTPAAKAGWAELTVLAEIADGIAACRVEPTPARIAAVVSSIAEMRRVHDATRVDAAKMVQSERDIGYGRFITYISETNTQLRLLQAEQPDAYATLMTRLGTEQPAFLQMLPIQNTVAAEAKKASQVSMVQTLRSQLELFKLQHDEDALDLRMGWAQLIKRTDPNGRISENGKYGPYLQTSPVNPITGGSQIRILTADAGHIALAGHNGYDFVYHVPSGRFYSLDETGKLVEADADVVIPTSASPRLGSAAKAGIKITPKPARSR